MSNRQDNTKTKNSKKEQVVIVGAGPAGITAGLALLQQSDRYNVTIVEQSSAIGGISRTVNHNGNRMDIGGHRFFSKSEQVNQWWEQILPNDFLIRDRLSRIHYKGKVFDYPIQLNATTIKNLVGEGIIPVATSYVSSTMHPLPEDSLENFYINRFGKQLYQMFFEGYTKKLWGRHPKEISAEWGAQRVKGISIKEVLHNMVVKSNETSFIEQFHYPKYGPGQMWETAMQRFQDLGGVLETNTKVVQIIRSIANPKRTIAISTENVKTRKRTQRAVDYVISSMPLSELVQAMVDVPDNIFQIAVGLPYRDFVTVGILFDKNDLIDDFKDCWMYIQDPGIHMGRIQFFNNWSPAMVQKPDENVFLGTEYFCKQNSGFWNMEEKPCADFVMKELRKLGIIKNDAKMLDYHREYAPKAYPAYFDTYQEINQLRQYLDTIENLYCVGRNGQHRYNNMDHSMLTALKAVEAIINHQQTHDEIWDVNTEQEYHEQG